jgi:hypothetical protein
MLFELLNLLKILNSITSAGDLLQVVKQRGKSGGSLFQFRTQTTLLKALQSLSYPLYHIWLKSNICYLILVVSKVSTAATSASRLSKLSVNFAIITPTIFTNVLWLQENPSAKNMHTQKDGGVDVDLAQDLETNFTWMPPLATSVSANSANLEGPGSISVEELEAAFAELEQVNRGTQEAALDPQLDGQEISAGKVYDFSELDQVEKGLLPMAFEEANDQIGRESASGT